MLAGGLVLHLQNAHISGAEDFFEPVAGSRKLRTAESAKNHFAKKVDDAKLILSPPSSHYRGRLGWNGIGGSPCCFDLRCDRIGAIISRVADSFMAFPPAKGAHLTMSWLPGRTLHLSVYNKVTHERLPELRAL